MRSFTAAMLAVAVLSSAAGTAFAADVEKKSDAADKPADKPADKATDKATTTTTTTSAGATGTAAATTTETTTATATSTEAATAPTSIPADSVDKNDAREIPGQTYYFVGLRYRHTILPKFLLNLFVDGGPTAVSIPSFGVEAGMRKDGFDVIGALTYSDYSTDRFPFKGKSEADTAYELVTSNLKLINATVDFLWSVDFSTKVAFQYGVTAGVAVVLGDLKRTQAKPASGNAPGDPYSYVPCSGVRDPQAPAYCDDSNNHYGDYAESSWFNGGKKPNFYAVFGPMFSLRYKPVHQFVARVDVGFNIFTGFFFGPALNYGF